MGFPDPGEMYILRSEKNLRIIFSEIENIRENLLKFLYPVVRKREDLVIQRFGIFTDNVLN